MRVRLKGYVKFLVENSVLLILGTTSGLLWANIDSHHYSFISHHLDFLINDIGMAFFFGIAAKEVFEALLPGGPLDSVKKASLPLLATMGGMILPALLYVSGALLLSRHDLLKGWAIPCATDIAFSYMVARFVFGAKHPAIPFLLILAIADDALGLLILALFYPVGQINLVVFLLLLGAAVASAFVLRRLRVSNFWPYVLISGPLSWFGFYLGGFHPALALVPVIFTMPHAKQDIGMFEDAEGGLTDTLNRFEHWWEKPVEVILGLFGLVNAGVALTSISVGTWLVLIGLLAGKPLGICLFCLIGRLSGLRLPTQMKWKDIVVIGFAASIGFTVALFVSTVAFGSGGNLDTVKMGSLFSFSGILLTIAVARLVRVRPMIPAVTLPDQSDNQSTAQ
jgi:NhaA family Na+:H+ antiporter